MKSLIVALAVSSSAAFAASGQISGGGTSEAPWVRSQVFFSQVLEYFTQNSLSPESIAFDQNDHSKIIATQNCYNGRTSKLVFQLRERCKPDVVIVCMPERSVTLDSAQSTSCN